MLEKEKLVQMLVFWQEILENQLYLYEKQKAAKIPEKDRKEQFIAEMSDEILKAIELVLEKSELRKALNESIEKFQKLLGSPDHNTEIEQNAVQVTLRELSKLKAVTEFVDVEYNQAKS